MIPLLEENPEKSEYYRKVTPKGVQKNFFYVTHSANTDINADDNEAYIKPRNTTKLYAAATGQVFIARRNDAEYYYNNRIACNSYTRVDVPLEESISVGRDYGKDESFALTRAVINISYLSDGPEIIFVAVVYLAESTIKESTPFLPHGNTTKDSFLTKPYIRANKGVSEKTKQMARDGVTPKTINDTINNNTGVYISTSRSNELRDNKQVYRQSQQLKAERKCGDENHDKKDELIVATELQQEKKDFILAVLCLRNSYYMFIADDVQSKDFAFLCVDKNGISSIDTTFNLCSNWVIYTCYENTRLQNGQHPFFLGPILIHFEKDAFIFNRFASEMCSFQ